MSPGLRAVRVALSPEFRRYLIVGIFNTAFGYTSFAILTFLIEGLVPFGYLLAGLCSSILNVTVSFLNYKWFVFRTHGHYFSEWVRCLVVYGWSITAGLLMLAPAVWGVRLLMGESPWVPYIGGALVMGGQVMLSFLGHSRFAFGMGSRGSIRS